MSTYLKPKPSIKYPWQESHLFYGAVALVVAVLVTAGLSVSGVFHSMHLW